MAAEDDYADQFQYSRRRSRAGLNPHGLTKLSPLSHLAKTTSIAVAGEPKWDPASTVGASPACGGIFDLAVLPRSVRQLGLQKPSSGRLKLPPQRGVVLSLFLNARDVISAAGDHTISASSSGEPVDARLLRWVLRAVAANKWSEGL